MSTHINLMSVIIVDGRCVIVLLPIKARDDDKGYVACCDVVVTDVQYNFEAQKACALRIVLNKCPNVNAV